MNDPKHVLPTNPGQRVVMVVDDEVMITHIARIALEEDGHFVLTAEDGEKALELSRQFLGPIHLLVTDIVMPGMDGFELRERIVSERPGMKVLLMSGQVDSQIISGPFLRKPSGIETLREHVRQLLASAASG